MDATDFGKRIANARRLKGLTQAELGDAVGVSKGSVRNWETGGKTPRDALPRLEQVLEVDLGSGGYVGPDREDADGVLLDLPDEALEGLTEAERDEVITAARLAALQRAREIRGR